MEVSMEDAASEQKQHVPDPLQQQQQQQQQQLQPQAERIHHTLNAQNQAHAVSVQQSTAVLQQPPEHLQQQQPRTLDSQQQQQQQQQQEQQQQEQQQGAPRNTQGSKYKQRPEDEGPNVDKWWLSESEGEGDEDDEQQLLKSEDPLYDPEADDADEAWAEEQRSGRTTDAILSCPGCFTTLCIDCQQHEVYHTQYRAMFTQNCEVKLDEVMQTQVQRQQQRGRKRRADTAAPQGLDAGEGDVLHPVCCAVCGTQVGAQDADEIVHFYQVLASEC